MTRTNKKPSAIAPKPQIPVAFSPSKNITPLYSPKQALLKISGHVQGVFYRAYAQEEAQKLGLTGYAKNMPDGSVEALLKGPETQINSFIEWAHKGSPGAKVDKVEIEWQTPDQDIENFEIY